METRDLPLDLVYPNPDQPRKVFDPKKLEELGESIRTAGLLQAIQVRADGAGRFMIVVGERRYRAHRLLGAATIRATIVLAGSMTDDQLADAAIIENLQRADITPLEEAKAFQRRLDTGITVEELAKRLGLKQAWRITERTSLLKLSPEIQYALSCGIIGSSQAYELSRLAPHNQKILFDALGAGKCATYAELRRTTETLLASERQVDMFAAEKPVSDVEKTRATRLERAIEAAAKAIGEGFDGNDCVALRRVSHLKAEVLVEQLALMEKALRDIRLNLAAACVATGKKAA